MKVMPFATNRYLNLLRGNASNAWQNGGGGTVEVEAVEAVEAAEKEGCRLQQEPPSQAARRGGAGGGAGGGEAELPCSRLPALLRVPLGLLRKMVRVRVERAGAVTLHHSPPKPDSAARRRARHLLRAPGTRDELVKHDGLRCAQPLPKGTLLDAVRSPLHTVTRASGCKPVTYGYSLQGHAAQGFAPRCTLLHLAPLHRDLHSALHHALQGASHHLLGAVRRFFLRRGAEQGQRRPGSECVPEGTRLRVRR